MAALLAVALWCWHGVILFWNWGKFRPHIALLHGVGMAVVAGGLLVLTPPAWVVYLAGAAIGGAGGYGHRLAPGLWVGVALLGAVPFLFNSSEALLSAAALALTAQVAAVFASLTRHSG